jgi:SAM-dependent methyltransferase
MIEKAKERMQREGLTNVEFRVGDVLVELRQIPRASVDVVLSTWLIGYVGCDELFPLVKRVLRPGGLFGFVAHLDRSPQVPIEVFEEITREEPGCLTKAARMKFPQNDIEVNHHLANTGLNAKHVIEGKFYYIGKSGRDVYDHVMKSGAGTTFYYSLKSECRERLAEEFMSRIDQRYTGQPEICIEHRYVIGIARA